jgi:hypothetical protein
MATRASGERRRSPSTIFTAPRSSSATICQNPPRAARERAWRRRRGRGPGGVRRAGRVCRDTMLHRAQHRVQLRVSGQSHAVWRWGGHLVREVVGPVRLERLLVVRLAEQLARVHDRQVRLHHGCVAELAALLAEGERVGRLAFGRLVEDDLHTCRALHNSKLDPLGPEVDAEHLSETPRVMLLPAISSLASSHEERVSRVWCDPSADRGSGAAGHTCPLIRGKRH